MRIMSPLLSIVTLWGCSPDCEVDITEGSAACAAVDREFHSYENTTTYVRCEGSVSGDVVCTIELENECLVACVTPDATSGVGDTLPPFTDTDNGTNGGGTGGGNTEEDPGGVDEDGDGIEDSSDMLLSAGNTLCFHDELIGWTTTVYIVGYGFGGDNDWTDLTHQATPDGEYFCYQFDDGTYRVNAWSGDGNGSYVDWGFLDSYCPTNTDPVCWQNTADQGGGYATCFVVVDGAIGAAPYDICAATG